MCQFSGQRKGHVCTFSAGVFNLCCSLLQVLLTYLGGRMHWYLWSQLSPITLLQLHQCTSACTAWSATCRTCGCSSIRWSSYRYACLGNAEKVGCQQMPFSSLPFPLPLLLAFPLLLSLPLLLPSFTFCTRLILSSRVLAKGRPKYYRHKSIFCSNIPQLPSPRGMRIGLVSYCCSDIEK